MTPRRGSGRVLGVSICDARGRPLQRRALAAWLRRTIPVRYAGAVTVALVSDGVIRRLNLRHRGVDRPTDVLSFPAEDGWRDGRWAPAHPAARPRLLGDVVIALGVAGRQARAAGHAVETELRVLALHGVLHLVGYDHERDAEGMARVERRLRRAGGLPGGLIERSEVRR